MTLFKPIKHFFNRADANQQAAPQSEEEKQAARQNVYIATIEAERAHKDAEFRNSPYSPLDAEARQNFAGISYYPPAPAMQMTLPLQRIPPEPIIIHTNTGDEQPFNKIGTVEFEIEGKKASLAIYQGEGDAEGELFAPFKDATNGAETYGAGRYLEPVLLSGNRVVVDFNLAYNPYCAYSENFVCPLPPRENWLKVPIRAGEKQFKI